VKKPFKILKIKISEMEINTFRSIGPKIVKQEMCTPPHQGLSGGTKTQEEGSKVWEDSSMVTSKHTNKHLS
jgi:hypothetical protein